MKIFVLYFYLIIELAKRFPIQIYVNLMATGDLNSMFALKCRQGLKTKLLFSRTGLIFFKICKKGVFLRLNSCNYHNKMHKVTYFSENNTVTAPSHSPIHPQPYNKSSGEWPRIWWKNLTHSQNKNLHREPCVADQIQMTTWEKY